MRNEITELLYANLDVFSKESALLIAVISNWMVENCEQAVLGINCISHYFAHNLYTVTSIEY